MLRILSVVIVFFIIIEKYLKFYVVLFVRGWLIAYSTLLVIVIAMNAIEFNPHFLYWPLNDLGIFVVLCDLFGHWAANVIRLLLPAPLCVNMYTVSYFFLYVCVSISLFPCPPFDSPWAHFDTFLVKKINTRKMYIAA